MLKRKLRLIYQVLNYVVSPLALPVLAVLALICRFLPRKYDVCLGPIPMINNVYHKKALEAAGYKARTFVCFTYYITQNFDVNFEWIKNAFSLRYYVAFFYVVKNFKCIYIYFNGGPLAWTPLRIFEARLLKLAGVKIVAMPYGADVQDLDSCPNLIYKNAVCRDYPDFQKVSRKRIQWQIEYWTQNSDHVISGCDWVDYMYHWDTLMPAHFSIDIDSFEKVVPAPKSSRFTVLHAPNHREIKGTRALERAVRELQKEGIELDLKILEKIPNEQLKGIIAAADLIVDQLVIGWHGIFALEALALGKPVICFLRRDLIDLFLADGCIDSEDEIPFISADYAEIKERLRSLIRQPDVLKSYSDKSKNYACKYHSLEKVGSVFDKINRKLAIK